ncbi:DNA-deoxyinosine glycosylase [Curvibacter sp. RS43]|uniref:DNA-deoxyinosine glycosylase n=1 Tax=Curvibacter microcysteis TaxID=3026419 RepID=A0ABT5MJR1_9BURK|nr:MULTISPECIES: DNA-deoxyinosine glycosylase [unclassified Curvibacter]MDD0811860.1 DNA-deoxyinosine glycosylase [Curvibacter sp. RS43]MDD0816625.1 DNA-deoxyinosine glycosylase [Curvibacter sp. HBC28]
MSLQGLAPVLNADTRLLILGSFPGVRSLALQQYYGHPQNQFWRILGTLWQVDLRALDYPQRLQALLSRGVGLWDVYAACEREGSLDADIRQAQLNDLASLRQRCPSLALIAHNGGESFRHARHTRALGLPVCRLPSSSPANASQRLEHKVQAWGEALRQAGLL